MTTSSNEFAALVNKLHETPNDPVIKAAVVRHLPKMLALAQGAYGAEADHVGDLSDSVIH